MSLFKITSYPKILSKITSRIVNFSRNVNYNVDLGWAGMAGINTENNDKITKNKQTKKQKEPPRNDGSGNGPA